MGNNSKLVIAKVNAFMNQARSKPANYMEKTSSAQSAIIANV